MSKRKYTVDEIVKLGPVIPVLKFDSVEEGIAVSRALYAIASRAMG